jgi:ribulose-phosphate 3-epimerase
LRALLDASGRRGDRVRIEIDGGIVPGNIAEVAAAGAEIFVAGSSVFGQPDPAEAVRELLRRGSTTAA